MRGDLVCQTVKTLVYALAAALAFAPPALGQQTPDSSAEHEAKGSPVVRTFGAEEGGYRTEVRSETKGTLSQDDRRQVSLLAAKVFQHVDEARRALDGDDLKRARAEVDKGREAIRAVRALLPTTTVHTRTTAPDGKVIYEDRRDVQDDRVPLFEGLLHAQTLAPIQAAQRDAGRVAGLRVVESESVTTEVTADLDAVESQLSRAARAIEDRKPEDAGRALLLAQVRGVDLQYHKEDAPLAEARDAIWLAKRALEEDNSAQAQANLAVARQRLEVYRQVLPENKRADVTRMMTEVQQLEAKLRQESGQTANRTDRAHQGGVVGRWWDQVNGWFKRRP